MNYTAIDIQNKLISMSDYKYKKFSSSLIPNCNDMLGVRIPLIRKLAKDISNESAKDYIENYIPFYFEEKMLKGFLIAKEKDVDKAKKYILDFFPTLNNWSLCDSFCCSLNIIKNNKALFWYFLIDLTKSKEAFSVRFAIVCILDFYICDEYLMDIFELFDEIKNSDYYIITAIAWAVSVCYAKYPLKTKEFLLNNELSDEVMNKSIQKICESKRVSPDDKNFCKALKRI